MSNSFKTRPTHFSCGGENVSRGDFGPVDFYTSQKTKIFLRSLSAVSILV